MAEEIAYGAKEVSTIQLTIRRIADDIPMEVISKDSAWTTVVEDLKDRYPGRPVEKIVKELPLHDAIIFGSPTRFGNMAAQMKAMWDMTTELWTNGSLIETQFLYLHKFFYGGVTTFTSHLLHMMGLTRKSRKRFISLLSLETAVADAAAPYY
jgi:multimeric flavodoxin WrbA